jgi:hypothetical protein
MGAVANSPNIFRYELWLVDGEMRTGLHERNVL